MPQHSGLGVRNLARAMPADPATDQDLLTRFVQHQDPVAFELLVWRHGAMVLAVGQRLLRHEADAEDAFQAVFLILARKAESVRGATLPGWLHRVARRVATQLARRRPGTVSLTLDPLARPDPDPDLLWALDEAIDCLPERFRLPVVLCCLEGRSTETAARILGVPRGTILSRLATARQKLAVTLTRQGLTIPVTLVGFGLGTETLSAACVQDCTQQAIRFVSGLGGSTVPYQLAVGVLSMSTRLKIAGWTAALILLVGVGSGVGVLATPPDPNPVSPALVTVQTRPSDPPRRDPEVNEDRKRLEIEKQRLDKIRRLQVQSRELQERIEDLSQVQTRLHRELAERVDAKALQSFLAQADNDILKTEDKVQMTRDTIAKFQAMIAKTDQWVLPEPDLMSRVDQTEKVVAARTELNRHAQEAAKLRNAPQPDAMKVERANRREAELLKDLEAAQAAARPITLELARAEHRKNLQFHIARAEQELQDTLDALKTQLARRKRLAERYAQAKSLTAQIQLHEDELQVYREVRQAVIRQRLFLELGLDEK